MNDHEPPRDSATAQPAGQRLVPPSGPPTGTTTAAQPVEPDRQRPVTDYQVLGEMARGPLRVVLRGRCLGGDRLVTLEFLLARPFTDSANWPRFVCETRTLAGLQHLHLVPVCEVGVQHDQPYFTTTLVEGSQARQLADGLAQPDEVARLLVRLARVVQQAHKHPLGHAKLNPGKILLDAELLPYLAGAVAARQSPQPSQAVAATPSSAAEVPALAVILAGHLGGWKVQAPDGPLEVIGLKCRTQESGPRWARTPELADELECWLRDESSQPVPTGDAN